MTDLAAEWFGTVRAKRPESAGQWDKRVRKGGRRMVEAANIRRVEQKGRGPSFSNFAVFSGVLLSMGVSCGGDNTPEPPPGATAPKIVSQPPVHVVAGD